MQKKIFTILPLFDFEYSDDPVFRCEGFLHSTQLDILTANLREEKVELVQIKVGQKKLK